MKEVKDQQSKLDIIAQQFENVTKVSLIDNCARVAHAFLQLALDLQKQMQSMTLSIGDTPGPSQTSQ